MLYALSNQASHRRGFLRWLVAMCFCGWLVPGLYPQPAPGSPKEFEIKAAFLFRLAQFMEWPTNRFRSGTEPLVVAVLGKDPFGAAIDTVLANQKIGDHSILVQRPDESIVLTNLNCHVLFVSPNLAGEMEKIVASFRTNAVLTVGESEDFTKKGGHVRLYLQENRLRFEINIAALERSGLKLHSQVMKLAARITRDGKDVKQ